MRLSRRDFVARSLGWTVVVTAGCAGVRSGDAPEPAPEPATGPGAAPSAPPAPARPDDPIDESPDFANSATPGALPFLRDFTGDDFRRPHDVLIDPDTTVAGLPGKKLPEPDETVPLVIVGGGLGGLAAAHLLRDLKPVLLEQAPRFGGNSKGERWRDSVYAIGGAYYIQADEGDELDAIYKAIGIDGKARKLEVPDPVEFHGKVFRKFFDGEAEPAAEAAYATWREKMHHHAEEAYPDIPVTDEEGRALVNELDARSLQDVVTEWLGGKVPESLRAAIQNYCYSSMGCGWQEVSAAGAINFLAGEEFGVLALPGGNGAMARALVASVREAAGDANLRAGHLVFDVRDTPEGVRVSYADPKGAVRTILAKAVVMACPKYVVKHVLKGMEPDRTAAIEALKWRGYMVVNVLVDSGIEDDFYDMYLLRDGAVVESGEVPTRATDVILGNWARTPGLADQSVLTLYWPLPFDAGREQILYRRDAWEHLRPQVERQVLDVVALLGLKPEMVRQVRMTRWGHAVPVSSVGFIAAGHADVLRRPLAGRVFFVNQDNWALPAVETALTEAIEFAPAVRAAAGG